MAESIQFPSGTPSWTDLATPDVDASTRFYSELFGWEITEAGPADQTGGYRNIALGGRRVGGMMPMQNEGQPPVWTTYVSVDDAEATAKAVTDAGGTTMFEPMDVMDLGRMAVFSDGADGAVFAVWQPRAHAGAEVVNQPGAMVWNELDTRDLPGAERFYGAVFGWTAEPIEQDGDVVYASWKLAGRTVGGIMPMNESFPAEVPANWLVYFGVDDLDASVRKVEELGGQVRMPRMQMPAGAFAVVADQHGATLGLWHGTYEPPPGG